MVGGTAAEDQIQPQSVGMHREEDVNSWKGWNFSFAVSSLRCFPVRQLMLPLRRATLFLPPSLSLSHAPRLFLITLPFSPGQTGHGSLPLSPRRFIQPAGPSAPVSYFLYTFWALLTHTALRYIYKIRACTLPCNMPTELLRDEQYSGGFTGIESGER